MSFDPKRKAIGSTKSSGNLIRRGFEKLQLYLREKPEPPEDEPLTSFGYALNVSMRIILIVAISTISGGLVALLGQAIFGSAIQGFIEKVLESRITIAKAVIYLLLALLGGVIVAWNMLKKRNEDHLCNPRPTTHSTRPPSACLSSTFLGFGLLEWYRRAAG